MTQKLSKTYKEVAKEFIESRQPTLDPDEIVCIKQFAKYLDGFHIITPEMEQLAIQKSREIDREVMFALAKELSKEKVEEIIRGVHSRHRHSKKKVNEQENS